MTQLILIATLASLPPYFNRMIVRKQMREEAIHQRAKWRRELYRQTLNQWEDEDR